MDINGGKYRNDSLRAVRERGIIPIYGEITPDMGAIIKDSILDAVLRQTKHLTVLIDSPGGNDLAGVGIANTLSLAGANGMDVQGVVIARAFSAAFSILQACQNRIAFRGTLMMLHWGRNQIGNDELDAIMEKKHSWVLGQILDSQREMVDIIALRSGLNKKKIRKMCKQEVYLSPKRALKLGFLDRIADASSFEIPGDIG